MKEITRYYILTDKGGVFARRRDIFVRRRAREFHVGRLGHAYNTQPIACAWSKHLPQERQDIRKQVRHRCNRD